MTLPQRFAVYHLAGQTDLAAFSASWLGWDSETGTEPPAPDLPALPMPLRDITAEPRRYGFHATLKAPFRLAEGTTPEELDAALGMLAQSLRPVMLAGLSLRSIGGFLALTPDAPSAALQSLAAACVEALDSFRAPLTSEDRARRRPERLSPDQCRLLDRWGYPFVMEEFRYHMTLTGPLSPRSAAQVADVLAPRLAPLLPRPWPVATISLLAEGADGRFRLIRHYPLTASPAT